MRSDVKQIEAAAARRDFAAAIAAGDVAAAETAMRSAGFKYAVAETAKRDAAHFKRIGLETVVHGLLLREEISKAALQLAAARRKALEARVTALEGRAMSYRGVWKEGEDYEPRDMVTLKGGLWCSWAKTKARPGTCGDWQLAAKSPHQDGRDAR